MNQTQVTKIIPILHLIYLAMVTTKNVKNGHTMDTLWKTAQHLNVIISVLVMSQKTDQRMVHIHATLFSHSSL